MEVLFFEFVDALELFLIALHEGVEFGDLLGEVENVLDVALILGFSFLKIFHQVVPVEFETGVALCFKELNLPQQGVILLIGLSQFFSEFVLNVGLEVFEPLLKVFNLVTVVSSVLLDDVIEGLDFFL